MVSRRSFRKNRFRLKRFFQSLLPGKISGYARYYTRRKRKNVSKLIYTLARLFFVLFILGILSFAGIVIWYSKEIPSPYKLTNREIAQSTRIYDRNNKLLYEIYGDENRSLVNLGDVSQYMINATLAAEDPTFYKHQGIDIKGIARSFFKNLTNQGLYGGSTITQQLVKNTLLTPERTITRKIKELILTIQIERRYNKDEILQMYLNEVPYGGQSYGVKAAANTYFGKEPKDLSLVEAALLAGLTQSPSYYSPFGAYPENAKGRQEYVLYLMQKHGFITQEQVDTARKEELKYAPQIKNILAPHFVMYVKSILTEKYGDKMAEQGGLKVTTTLDYNMQLVAEEEAKFNHDRLDSQNANAQNSALVAIDPRTGEILTMLGSIDYFDTANDGNVNVTLSERQPGSSIKPITYVTAFTKGYTAATFVSDIQTTWPSGGGPYTPQESDGRFWGPLLVRDALANSRNVPAVKMLQLVGIPEMLKMAHNMGITTLNEPEKYGLALTLGGGEVKLLDLTSAFGVFAASGVRHSPTAILKVEDSKGKILEEFKPSQDERVFDEKYAYLISNILSDNVARSRLFGFGSLLQIRDWKVAVKTGTTNDNKDAWTVGYAPNLVTGVWTGNNNNDPMNGIQGSTGATPLWHYFMERVLDGKDRGEFKKPENDFISLEIDALSGKLVGDGTDKRKWEIFIKGTQPTEKDDFHVKVEVCKGTDFLATDYHKQLGLTETKTYTYLKEINDSWQPYTDGWIQAVGGFQKPPTEHCQTYEVGRDGPSVTIKSPQNGAVLASEFTADVEATSPVAITKVDFFWDNTLYKTLETSPFQVNFKLSAQVSGEHTMTVRAKDVNGKTGEASSKITIVSANSDEKQSTPSAQ
ncbi:penicillin-binding protein [candidate division WWE3 bacterium CG_4_8_14_3_um_filter_42_11]|uniref:Penicillin-binding protein n=2 Tax=Katanobacteria TaxID=422282 RepID=A0A2M7WXG2_UNCKA|nr:MAG: penicillin-binding protein [candidate division WWE3 bacterium CG_4_9_14_3_um_filter_43_9]PJC68073.1 MAG: penicillin-binding protein [candidate division WWE3 bacterium CG_4_8_14_3_um_filter_42_11]